MRSYRCYFLNPAGRIAAVEIVEADTDEDALIEAARRLNGQPHHRASEVWDCARRVFPPARDKVDVDKVGRVLRGVGLRVSDDRGSPPGQRHGASPDT